jgi:hypothetical protein
MTEKKPDEPEDSDEDWMKYANAGFGETDYSLWDDEEVTEAPIEADDDWDDADESPDQLSTHMEEIPRAPSPAWTQASGAYWDMRPLSWAARRQEEIRTKPRRVRYRNT